MASCSINNRVILLDVGYVDAVYARRLDDKRSTTSYELTLGKGPICWKSMV